MKTSRGLFSASSENLVFCWVRGHLARIFQQDAGETPRTQGFSELAFSAMPLYERPCGELIILIYQYVAAII